MDKDLKAKTIEELEEIVDLATPTGVVGLGPSFAQRATQGKQQKYLAEYIFRFVQALGVTEISQISPLSKAFRERLIEQGYYISQLKIIDKLTDPDGTVKYVFKLADGSGSTGSPSRAESRDRIETVLLFDISSSQSPKLPTKDTRRRRTLCISTQVGCAMGCVFCATGRIKLKRNLTAGEIVDQVNFVCKDGVRITNVVYMGMGEPLQNYDAVVKSIRILNHPAGKNIGIRRLTVSTCGVASAIKKLADENVHPRLAISLNAPTDALRTKLMPINAKFPISDVLSAAKFYLLKTKQRVTFEYVLIKGVNDAAIYAQTLAKLLKGSGFGVNPPHAWRINLIEYNPHPKCTFAAGSVEGIKRFSEILEKAGIKTTIRLRLGQSINAACGQLGADWTDDGKM